MWDSSCTQKGKKIISINALSGTSDSLQIKHAKYRFFNGFSLYKMIMIASHFIPMSVRNLQLAGFSWFQNKYPLRTFKISNHNARSIHSQGKGILNIMFRDYLALSSIHKADYDFWKICKIHSNWYVPFAMFV